MNKYITTTIIAIAAFMPLAIRADTAGAHAELSVSVDEGKIKGVLRNISTDTLIWHSPRAGDKSLGSSRAIKVQYKLKKSSEISPILSHATMDSDIFNDKHRFNRFSALQPQASVVFIGDVNTMGGFLRTVVGKMEDIERVRFSVHVSIGDGAEDATKTEYISHTPWYVITKGADKKYVITLKTD
ncbi:hypothetical protein [Ereboglobus luteus]|uniref:Lipid/polyisoprenoid-binding YceI-like domain-containing protein n=1 Tax=Ereboglobus luteus TaxID=1796921 RepID=A0A2U8DZF8_9BACT|nr:hypothetical protein [Ereboglobus luteus]AWI07997.1 hypothetical protein CKA38_00825 [Ereboglobus luteus]